MYHLGWVTGTGGGISIKLDDEIYIAPSGVQKERMQLDDIFIQNMEGEDLVVPPEYKKLKKSQCTPLFMVAYREREAGACIHTHSPNAVMATLLWPGKEFRITHQEMIKVCGAIIICYVSQELLNLSGNLRPPTQSSPQI